MCSLHKHYYSGLGQQGNLFRRKKKDKMWSVSSQNATHECPKIQKAVGNPLAHIYRLTSCPKLSKIKQNIAEKSLSFHSKMKRNEHHWNLAVWSSWKWAIEARIRRRDGIFPHEWRSHEWGKIKFPMSHEWLATSDKWGIYQSLFLLGEGLTLLYCIWNFQFPIVGNNSP